MNNENYNLASPEEPVARSPEMLVTETNNTRDDQDDAEAMILRNQTIFVFINDDDTSVQMGDCQPTASANIPIVATNYPPFDDQPVEVDVLTAQTVDEIPYAPSPTDWDIADDVQVPLSPETEIVAIYDDAVFDMIPFEERDTQAEPVENDDNEIEILHSETVAVQTVESPPQNLAIIDAIQQFPVEVPVVIDLTQDDAGVPQVQPIAVESPGLIDLTQDDDGAPQVQPIPDTTPINDIETETHPPVVLLPTTEILLPVAARSLEAADQNLTFAHVIDNTHQPIETSAHLQIAIPLHRANKRSNSADEIHQMNKKIIPQRIKRSRNSVN